MPNWSPSSSRIVFTILEGALHATRGERQTSVQLQTLQPFKGELPRRQAGVIEAQIVGVKAHEMETMPDAAFGWSRT